MTRECSIDHCNVDLDGPLAGPAHARAHKNEFERMVGRRPRDYEEVRELFNRGKVPEDADSPSLQVTTLDEFGRGERHDQAGFGAELTTSTRCDEDA